MFYIMFIIYALVLTSQIILNNISTQSALERTECELQYQRWFLEATCKKQKHQCSVRYCHKTNFNSATANFFETHV